jgi:hypothetical protein
LLFDLPEPVATNLPEGLACEPDFLGADDERALIDLIRALPLAVAIYKQYIARRRVISFG